MMDRGALVEAIAARVAAGTYVVDRARLAAVLTPILFPRPRPRLGG